MSMTFATRAKEKQNPFFTMSFHDWLSSSKYIVLDPIGGNIQSFRLWSIAGVVRGSEKWFRTNSTMDKTTDSWNGSVCGIAVGVSVSVSALPEAGVAPICDNPKSIGFAGSFLESTSALKLLRGIPEMKVAGHFHLRKLLPMGTILKAFKTSTTWRGCF